MHSDVHLRKQLADTEAHLATFRFRLAMIHSFFAIRTHCRQFQGLLEELQPIDLPAEAVVNGVREELQAALASLDDLTRATDLMQPPKSLRDAQARSVQGDPLDSIPESERADA